MSPLASHALIALLGIACWLSGQVVASLGKQRSDRHH